jgi:hypothetical protein
MVENNASLACTAGKPETEDSDSGWSELKYDIDEEKKTVHILAIGTKDRNRLIIGTEEFK